ncbi:hypothetical protein D9M68_831290 [compost metagenome]
MADAHADAELLVRAVDQITRHAQAELERPERIVRPRRHHGRKRITVSSVLFTDRLRRIPGRVGSLGCNGGGSNWRAPAFTADPQRVGMHHVLPFRVIVQTVLGEVDNDAFPRPRRQDVAGRQDDLGAGAREPGVHARVGGNHFQVAEVIGHAYIGEGVFILGLDHLDLADDIFARRRKGQLQGCDGARHQQGR